MASADLLVRLLLTGAAILYAGAAALLHLRRLRIGWGAFAAGWLLNATVWVMNGISCGEPPFGNMHHVLVFVGLCFLPLLALFRRLYGYAWVTPFFALASVLPVVGACFVEPGLNWKRVPALQSPWFVPHVTSYMLGYSLATVAFLLTLNGLVRRRRGGDEEDLARYERAGYRLLRLAFPLLTFGMLSGALWAEEAWGVYWSWDPKETWSLITWTLYLVYFHCRTRKHLQPYAECAQLTAFAALITTFLAVNLLPKLSSVLHSYA